jgi:hypothetical protein
MMGTLVLIVVVWAGCSALALLFLGLIELFDWWDS